MPLTFNPPTTAEGRWVIDFFAPWIKKGYPNPAAGRTTLVRYGEWQRTRG